MGCEVKSGCRFVSPLVSIEGVGIVRSVVSTSNDGTDGQDNDGSARSVGGGEGGFRTHGSDAGTASTGRACGERTRKDLPASATISAGPTDADVRWTGLGRRRASRSYGRIRLGIRCASIIWYTAIRTISSDLRAITRVIGSDISSNGIRTIIRGIGFDSASSDIGGVFGRGEVARVSTRRWMSVL